MSPSAYVRVGVPEIINNAHSSGRSRTLRLYMCTKSDFIRIAHLHTIKLCSKPLRRMKTRWTTHVGDLHCLDQQRQEMNQSAEVSVGWRKKPPFLFAGCWRHQAGSDWISIWKTSGCRGGVRTHMKTEAELSATKEDR